MVRMRDWDDALTPADIGTLLFGGEVIVFRNLAGVAALVDRVRALLEDAFGMADPQHAEAHMPPDDYRRTCMAARRTVERDSAVAAAWAGALGEIGFLTDTVYGDRMRLRIVPSRAAARGRRTLPLPAHRDTWGANVMAQVNWWLPLYPLAPTRTMCIWPELFDRPVPNTSSEWDFDALASGEVEDYPLLPQANHEPVEAGVPVMVEPGELIAFSAAHLHGSLVDGSGVTRLSLDTRTFRDADVRAGRGAPDVDGGGKQRWEWFSRLSDGESATAIFGARAGTAPAPNIHGAAG
jgi:hypothetical protein